MRKRPLFYGAVLFALLIFFLGKIIKIDFRPDLSGLTDQVVLTGEFMKSEEAGKKVSVYLKNVNCYAVGIPKENKEKAEDQNGKNLRIRLRKILLTMETETYQGISLLPGNRVQVKAKRTGFRSARNDGNYDEEAYYNSLGVQEKFQAEGEIALVSRRVLPVRAAMQFLRKKLTDSLENLAGGEGEGHAAIFTAIVTGDRSSLDPDTKELYRKSGIAHILAISGLHISLLGMTLFSFFRKHLPLTAAVIFSGFVMVLFCVMSGESASAVRASIMFLLRIAAIRLGRKFDLLSALGLSAILLLLHNPGLLFYSGFQLSFGAILGIGLLLPAFERLLSPREREQGHRIRGKALALKAAALFLASLSVTLMTLPVIINSYYEVPVFSVLLNLIVVPVMGMVLESGVFSALAGILSLFFGRLFLGAGAYLVSLIEFLCAVVDKIPFSIVITGRMAPGRVVIYYAVLFVILFLSFRIRISRMKSGAVFFGLGLVLLLILFAGTKTNKLRITFFDVDQGDGILIESPSGTVYLIDGGSSTVSDLYRFRLESALKYRGISKIDYLLISHPDTDHISGVLELLEDDGAGIIQAKNLLVPSIPENENYQELIYAAEKANVTALPIHSGMVIDDGSITLNCLHPEKDFTSRDSNAYSVVLLLSFDSFRAVFSGDIGEEEEAEIVKAGVLKDCDLLKVAHHGSKSSSSAGFLKTADPEIAVISAGVNNRYGHPHQEVLKRLEAVGAKVYLTAEQGEIRAEIDPLGTITMITKEASDY
ncbi:MAG: DNA internalization-related competence protein ComEC/Rec2 [Parasporobacterium sp.]|nr:DNA internalization-related competence protein ComEC/Rec2 [Parasporobacterium sp.]